jgi:hypothetical protein
MGMDPLQRKPFNVQTTTIFKLGSFSVLLVLLINILGQAQPVAEASPVAEAGGPAYGVNFVSYAGGLPMSSTRYANGRSTGATWNRWPMYWNGIEQASKTPPEFHWAFQDITAINDIANGWQINAILLGTPSFYTTNLQNSSQTRSLPADRLTANVIQSATPLNLYEPVFNDSTDIPGPGKQINDGNKWARFVYTAVNRYKPGGVLAQQEGWGTGVGITHWELWNEPDLISFWDGTTADYARLLKVGYVAARQADPNAKILFGGLANSSNNISFYNNVMAIYDADPIAAAYGYFHDIVATHNYLYTWESWYHVWRVGNALSNRGLEKPVWLNESGVPVWDDYPGPVCEPDSPFRASMTEQADFIIQSAFYATYAGADNIFFFQLYDDCGNQPGGTNFDWYPVSACTGDPAQDEGGDAFGLFRNAASGGCYWDHPQPETARPGLSAFQLLTTHFSDVEPLWRLRPGSSDPINGPQEWIAFYKGSTGERVLGMWARFGEEQTAVITPTNTNGQGILLHPDGFTEPITAVNGVYTVTLPAATNQNAIWDPTLYPIGGRPYILIETDTIPPELSLTVPTTATNRIELSWSGQDFGSGMADYDLLVAVDDGLPTPWLTATTAVNGTYISDLAHTYTFTLRGRDQAGNASIELSKTVLTIDLPEKIYLPVALKE